MNNSLDQVTLVDELDRVIGRMDKIEAHRGTAKRHRAISVFLWNAQGLLLMQKRSELKIVGAGLWANTCCGNVRPMESYEDCARRRLREELGIKEGYSLVPIDKFEYRVRCNDEFSEWEIDQIFIGAYQGAVTPVPAEVQAYEWLSARAVSDMMLHSPESMVPWLPYLLVQPELKKMWNKYGNQA